MRREEFVIPSSGQVLINAHPHTINCDIRGCALHAPTRHDMDDLPLLVASSGDPLTPLMVRVCKHDVEHPDPDSLKYWASVGVYDLARHECDGCCHHLARTIRDLTR